MKTAIHETEIARIIGGVHWPADIVSGFVVAVVVVWVCEKVARRTVFKNLFL